jgi:lysophospholipase L1-like esterase
MVKFVKTGTHVQLLPWGLNTFSPVVDSLRFKDGTIAITAGALCGLVWSDTLTKLGTKWDDNKYWRLFDNGTGYSNYITSPKSVMLMDLYDSDSVLFMSNYGTYTDFIGNLTVNGDSVLHKSDTAQTGVKGLVTKWYGDGHYALKGLNDNTTNQIYTLGNSLTAAGLYQSKLSTYIPSTFSIVNYGIGGTTSTQIRDRISTVSNGANTVIVWCGINDVTSGITALVIEANLQYIYTTLHNAGSKVVAMYITPFKGNASWSSGKQSVLDSVNTWIAGTATDVDYKLDLYTKLEGTADYLDAVYDSGDGLHLSNRGYDSVGSYIYQNVTFTPTTYTLKIAKNVTLSQNLGTQDSPTFSNLILNPSNAANQNPAIYFGASKILHTYGISNMFVGIDVGNSTLTGGFNTGLGNKTLNATTTGSNNTAIGYNTLYANTEGLTNTAIGLYAGHNNTTGSYNGYFGSYAGYFNTTLSNRIFIGTYPHASLQQDSLWIPLYITDLGAILKNKININGNTNIFGKLVITGADNYTNWRPVTNGSGFIYPNNSKKVILMTLYDTDTSKIYDYNVAFGRIMITKYGGTVGNNTSSRSVYIGDGENAKYITGGSDNIFIGYSAGRASTIAGNNVYIGNNTAYGNGYQVLADSNTYVGNGSGYSSTAAGNNTFIGMQSGYSNTTGNHNVFIGSYAGKHITTESGKLAIGSYNYGTKAGDSTKVIIYGHQTRSGLGQVLYVNADLKYQFVHGSAYDLTYTPSLTQNVPLKFTPGMTNTEADYLTIAGDTITVPAGSYYVRLYMGVASANNDDFEIRCRVNNVEYNTNLVMNGSTTSATNKTPFSYEWYLSELAASSKISFYITNLTNNNDPVITNTHLIITKAPE